MYYILHLLYTDIYLLILQLICLKEILLFFHNIIYGYHLIFFCRWQCFIVRVNLWFTASNIHVRVNCNTVEIGKFNALNVNKTKVKESYYTYRCRLVPFSRRQSVNILHFWTSFPKPPGQIQLNLAQCIREKKELSTFMKTMGHILFQREKIKCD